MSVSVRQDGRAVGGLERRVPRSGVEVIHADWLDGVAALAPASIDMLYADPPFMTGSARRDRAGAFDDRWPTPAHYIDWLRERLSATLPALRRSANILIHVDWRTSHRVRVMLDDLLGEDRFVNHLVWTYGLGGSSPRRFARKHDDILYYCLEPEAYWFEPPRVPATSRRMAGQSKKATDILDIPSLNNMSRERLGWPTQKPVALLDVLIRACCPAGGVVLDPCCGSGTTLEAAHLADRRAIGIDASTEAVSLTYDRLSTRETAR